jgi:parvulin-like peptidyl-prolyl isomerase
MESLDLLTNECIGLLHKNKLLKPLIRSELTKSTLKEVEIDEKLKEQLIINFNKKLGINNKNEFEAWLEVNETNQSEFEDLALADTRLKKYCEQEFNHCVEAHFLERKNQLDIVVYSLLRLKDFYKARELYLRISEQEADFGDLATLFSEGIENATRGIIGPVPLEQAHPALVDKLRNSNPGEIQPPIPIDGSYVIIRLESLDTALLDNFMRSKMLLELFNKFVDSKTNEYNQNLLNQARKNNNFFEDQST